MGKTEHQRRFGGDSLKRENIGVSIRRHGIHIGV